MFALPTHDTMNAYCLATYQLLAAPNSDFETWGLAIAAGRPLTSEMLAQLCRSSVRTDTALVFSSSAKMFSVGHNVFRSLSPTAAIASYIPIARSGHTTSSTRLS